MYNREYTPDRITELKPNEVFVFGSNLAGAHGGGAARLAYERFGAIWGQGVGLQGKATLSPPEKDFVKRQDYFLHIKRWLLLTSLVIWMQ